VTASTFTFTYPPEQAELRERARAYARRSIVLISISGIVLYLTTGNSQTMKTAWVTDVLSMIPSVALLIALKYELRPPTHRYPFGHFRAISICFLLTATVLLAMGVWLFLEAVLKLLHGERPPIGTVFIGGQAIWLGWAMIAALAFSMFVGMYCGRIKQPLAEKLHSKAIEAESATNRNEWMSEGAGIVGITLVAFGLWWADAVAAALISLQIIQEGAHNLRQVVGDLMDEAPSMLGKHELEDLPSRIKQRVEALDWVRQAAVRLREHGHVITGEIFIVPREGADLVRRIEQAVEELRAMDWRLHSLVVMPVSPADRRLAIPQVREN
jgi:cation diffusion facilitator family transporter